MGGAAPSGATGTLSAMANIWRFTVGGIDTLNGQDWVSHVHYRTDVHTGYGEPDAATVLDKVQSHYSSSGHNLSKWLGTFLSAGELQYARVYQEVETWNGEIATTAEETHSFAGTASGASTDADSSATCAWIALSTGFASRNFRGGTHIPSPISVTAVQSGRFRTDSGWWANLQTLGDAIIDSIDLTEYDLNPVIYSRTRRRRGQSPYAQDLSAYAVSREPRFIRRRQPHG